MIKTFTAAIFALVTSTHSGLAQSEKPDPRGAVMCIWMIYASLELIAEKCGAVDGDPAFFRTLQSNVDRMDAFIFRNSEITRKTLDQYLARSFVGSADDVCSRTAEPLALYEGVRQRGGEQLTQDIDKLLEVERPPVFNPCL